MIWPSSFLGQPRPERGTVVYKAFRSPKPVFYTLPWFCVPFSMIPGPENLSLIRVTYVTEQWPGPGPPQSLFMDVSGTSLERKPQTPQTPWGTGEAFKGARRPAVLCCKPLRLRRDFFAVQQLLFVPGPAPFSWVCFCTPSSVSSSVREQHSGASPTSCWGE